MNIGFIAEPYEEKEASGLGHFVISLLEALLDEGGDHNFFIYSTQPIKKERLINNSKNIIIPKGFLATNYWFYKNKDNKDLVPDVVLFNLPLLPFVMPKNIKVVSICHEILIDSLRAGSIFPDPIGFLKDVIRNIILMPISLRRSDIIVADSNATKEDVLKFHKIANEKIKVIYCGYQELRPSNEDCSKYESYGPFFLSAGKIKKRKNIHGVLNAFIEFKKRVKNDCKLVIVGSYKKDDGYFKQMIETIETNRLNDSVIFEGYVDAGSLYCLYKKSLAFVFPSFAEGFGMPVVEAMSLGVPVIVSDISVLKEVSGGAALVVDPANLKQLSEAMRKLYEDSTCRDNLILMGMERSKLFSWDKTARSYLCEIESLDNRNITH